MNESGRGDAYLILAVFIASMILMIAAGNAMVSAERLDVAQAEAANVDAINDARGMQPDVLKPIATWANTTINEKVNLRALASRIVKEPSDAPGGPPMFADDIIDYNNLFQTWTGDLKPSWNSAVPQTPDWQEWVNDKKMMITVQPLFVRGDDIIRTSNVVRTLYLFNASVDEDMRAHLSHRHVGGYLARGEYDIWVDLTVMYTPGGGPPPCDSFNQAKQNLRPHDFAVPAFIVNTDGRMCPFRSSCYDTYCGGNPSTGKGGHDCWNESQQDQSAKGGDIGKINESDGGYIFWMGNDENYNGIKNTFTCDSTSVKGDSGGGSSSSGGNLVLLKTVKVRQYSYGRGYR